MKYILVTVLLLTIVFTIRCNLPAQSISIHSPGLSDEWFITQDIPQPVSGCSFWAANHASGPDDVMTMVSITRGNYTNWRDIAVRVYTNNEFHKDDFPRAVEFGIRIACVIGNPKPTGITWMDVLPLYISN
jgi:hypothetical protein